MSRRSGQRSSEQASGRLGTPEGLVDGRTGTRPSSCAHPQAGPAAARQPQAAELGTGGYSGSRVRPSGERSLPSNNSSSPRLTEALLAELESQQKLHARKEKLVDVHGEDLTFLLPAMVVALPGSLVECPAAAKVCPIRDLGCDIEKRHAHARCFWRKFQNSLRVQQ